MPTYEYRCASCEKTFEVVQTMADKPLTRVPSTDGPCGEKCKAPVARVISGNINRRQGQTEATRDTQGHVTQKHWDGRQDVTINAQPVTSRTGINTD